MPGSTPTPQFQYFLEKVNEAIASKSLHPNTSISVFSG
jgi:hypothetical protein